MSGKEKADSMRMELKDVVSTIFDFNIPWNTKWPTGLFFLFYMFLIGNNIVPYRLQIPFLSYHFKFSNKYQLNNTLMNLGRLAWEMIWFLERQISLKDSEFLLS